MESFMLTIEGADVSFNGVYALTPVQKPLHVNRYTLSVPRRLIDEFDPEQSPHMSAEEFVHLAGLLGHDIVLAIILKEAREHFRVSQGPAQWSLYGLETAQESGDMMIIFGKAFREG